MNLQVLRLIAFLVPLSFGAALASSQTVADLAKQSESQQRQAIMASVDTAIKNLMSKTDRGGKPKSAQEIEESRAMANMLKALFTPDPRHPDEQSPGAKTILLRIKKGAAANPNQTLTDVMAGLVDPAFDHFYTSSLNANSKAIWATKSDADQVKLFRVSIEMLQNERLYQQTIKALKDEDAKLTKDMTGMEEDTVVLPDGRSIFQDKNGDLLDSNGTKLQGKDRELAERLGDCKARRGIKNGREALAACRDEVGIPRDSSTDSAPSAELAAATTPPAAAPTAPPPVVSPAPAAAPSADEDHPIFLVVMCVGQNLLEKYSYNNPPAGGKMAAFESITERYIRSVAKPGWEYWIEEAQFENFDARTAAPEALVSQISPESGRFDTSHPDCPSNYKWYQLPIKR